VITPISQLIIHPTVRPQQQRCYNLIQENWSQFHSFFCSLPTGSGKTDLAACLLTDYLSNYGSSEKIDILVPFRMHQDFWNGILQKYSRKHGFSVALLKGRGAYYCPVIKAGANIAPCSFDPLYAKTCRYRQRCTLLEARRRIRRSQVRILNWWVFKYVELGDEKATFRIFDEAHNLLNLESLVRVEIAYSFLQNTINEPEIMNQFKEWESELAQKQYFYVNMESGLGFIRMVQTVLMEHEMSIAKSLNNDPNTINLDLLRELRRITEMIMALAELIRNPSLSDLTFIFQRDQQKNQVKLVVQPFDLTYIFSTLFKGSKNLFMSATLGDSRYLANLLGMQPEYCYYIHETSSFAQENHPFIILKEAQKLSTANKEKKNRSFEFILHQSEPFLDLMAKLDLRGLILASSFELSRLMERAAKKYDLNVVTHSAGKSDEAIKYFVEQRKGDVLITPSAWEGISLDDDLARICLIPKLPFPMLNDPIIKKKIKKYPQFLENEVLISIQQAHGRIQRNPDDWGVTICFDGNILWLKNKQKQSLEPWFLPRIHEIPKSNALEQIKKLNLSDSKMRSEISKINTKSKPFMQMKKKDREWLESSGLADLLKK
jgi:Rad3-related DNA helicase